MSCRLKDVKAMLLHGRTRGDILRSGEVWGIQERQIDEYIKKATAEIAEANSLESDQHLAVITANLWELYRCHLKAKEACSARQCLLDIAKLRGLDKGEMTVTFKREHKGASDEELAAALAVSK